MDGLAGTFSRGLATVIDGKAVSTEILSEISEKTAELTTRYGKKPGLAVVLVGNRPDSARYVSMKKKVAKKIGIESFESVLSEDVDEETLTGKSVHEVARLLLGAPSTAVVLTVRDHVDPLSGQVQTRDVKVIRYDTVEMTIDFYDEEEFATFLR